MEDSTTETIRNSIDQKMGGDLGHATEMLSALWEIANEESDTINKVEDPSNASSSVSYFLFRPINESAYFAQSDSKREFERRGRMGERVRHQPSGYLIAYEPTPVMPPPVL